MRIAIVDDIASEREILKGRVAVQAARLSLDAAVFCYTSGTDFILKDGKKIPGRRDLAKAARTAFGDYLFKDFKSFGRRD